MIFCKCEQLKIGETAFEKRGDLIFCVGCGQAAQCRDCERPAEYLDVFNEPKCFTHDIVYLP